MSAVEEARPLQVARTLLVACGFAVLWLGLVCLLPVGLVYAKLQSDASIYLAQARFFWEHGLQRSVVLGDGLPVLVYSAMAGVIRAPLFGLATEADTLVRLVQVQNVAILAALASVSSVYLRLKLPQAAAGRLAYAPFVYISCTYNPWALNLVLPLGDHLYGLTTMSAFLASEVARRTPGLAGRRWAFAACAVALGLGAAQKFTSLALVVALLAGRRKALMLRGVLILLACAAIYFAWFHEVVLGYTRKAFEVYVSGRDPLQVLIDSVLNLLVAAVPSQIVPNFSYLFIDRATNSFAVTADLLSSHKAGWLALGLLVSGAVVRGAWICRSRMRLEIVFLALVLPVYALISNSTVRYLSSLQPVFLCLFVAGIATWGRVILPFVRRLSGRAAVVVCVGLMALIMVSNSTRSFTSRSDAAMGDMMGFLWRLSAVFDDGRSAIERLVRQEPDAAFVVQTGDMRWYPLAGVPYVAAEIVSGKLCAGKKVYAIFACDARNCARQLSLLQDERQLPAYAGIDFESVYSKGDGDSRIQVERLLLHAPGACS